MPMASLLMSEIGKLLVFEVSDNGSGDSNEMTISPRVAYITAELIIHLPVPTFFFISAA